MGMRIVPDTTNVPFTKWRNAAAIISLLAIVGSFVALYSIGLNFGVDFRGGVTIEVGPPEGEEFDEADLGAVRSAVDALGIGAINAKAIGGVAGAPGGIAVTVPLVADEEAPEDADAAASADDEAGTGIDVAAEERQAEVANLIKATLQETLGPDIEDRRTDIVGPTVSGELIQRGINATVLAIGLMLIYIWFRFEWQFSLGAILALVHDVILTMGIFAITQIDFTISIIAAILTIIGYSMNDTVVVYDRVRENLRKYKKRPLEEVIDLSLNQTLSRTLMTSITTLIALVSLFIFGGEVLRGFSFALIWGVVIGTYSSVFIAAPMLLRTGVKREWAEEGEGTAVAPSEAGAP